MYKGKHSSGNMPRRKRRVRFSKSYTMILALLVFLISVGSTLAFLTAKTDPVENVFTPSTVTIDIEENFDGTEKTNINVMNTGDTEVYIRVKLVTYRVNDKGDRIGGTAKLPEFTLGTNWVKYGDYYYYTLPVAPNNKPVNNLTNSMRLVEYDDADGGKQVVEVLAEGIQSKPASAVTNAWGVAVNADGSLKFQ